MQQEGSREHISLCYSSAEFRFPSFRHRCFKSFAVEAPEDSCASRRPGLQCTEKT